MTGGSILLPWMATTAFSLTIGQLARRTGLSVKTIRWYSDQGLVPPAGRTAAGYRLYGVEALARLELVRTLRRLGIDLRTIERVLAREVGLAEVAATHAEALDAEIRGLRLRRAVLRIVAERGGSPEEVDRMHELARLSEEERRHIITDFFDDVFGGLSIEPGFENRMRSVMPDLPDEPSGEQIDAWIELAHLVGDDGFRRRIRQMAEEHSAAAGARRAARRRGRGDPGRRGAGGRQGGRRPGRRYRSRLRRGTGRPRRTPGRVGRRRRDHRCSRSSGPAS